MILLELSRIMLIFWMALLERIGMIGERAGVVDAAKSTAAKSRVSTTIRKSAVAEPRRTTVEAAEMAETPKSAGARTAESATVKSTTESAPERHGAIGTHGKANGDRSTRQ